MADVQQITDDTFQAEVIESDLPFLLDFTAAWCGPCKMMGPIVEEISKEKADVLRVGVMDIDKNPKTPAQFTVMSIPTLILFKGGEVKDQIIGAIPKTAILERIGAHLG